ASAMKSILSIDGGGMKGYVPCAVLVELERRAGKPCYEMFDLVAGTSIGGILACCIAARLPASKALGFFTEDGPKIFGHQRFLHQGGVIGPRYDNQPLELALRNRLGSARLYNIGMEILVPAFDVRQYEPFFFKRGQGYDLWQVGMATSAAQTYFPGYKLDSRIFWDGGNVANNPCACAVAEAVKKWGDEPLRVLSLGCGSAISKFPPESLVSPGIVRAGGETMGLLFDANDELPNYILKQFLDAGYWRIQPQFPTLVPIDGASPSELLSLAVNARDAITKCSQNLDEFLAYSPVSA
ncbi:MAG: patatin-like phospholipase family protein, partial [Cyanobacteria bacterium REEB65]|nr:patatin-like phospholipase family protein [Cyanobacteria bacterium REEB65]